MNICSVVVHARLENLAAVQTNLERLPGVEVHGGSEEGKLIVTVEDTGDSTMSDTVARFNDVDGVINVVMIYHYGGDEDMDEEVISETK